MRDVVGGVKAKANSSENLTSDEKRRNKEEKERVKILRDLPFIVILFAAITVECNFVAILEMG
jgi:hypothetical protein